MDEQHYTHSSHLQHPDFSARNLIRVDHRYVEKTGKVFVNEEISRRLVELRLLCW